MATELPRSTVLKKHLDKKYINIYILLRIAGEYFWRCMAGYMENIYWFCPRIV